MRGNLDGFYHSVANMKADVSGECFSAAWERSSDIAMMCDCRWSTHENLVQQSTHTRSNFERRSDVTVASAVHVRRG